MRIVTFYQVGHDYACTDESGAIIGVVKSLDDRFIIPPREPVRNDYRRLKRDNRPMELYFKDPEVERAIKQYAVRKREQRYKI